MDDIVARLDLPWTAMPALTEESVIMHRVYDDDGHCIAECSSADVAEAIAEWSHAALRVAGEA